jgi:hypothetical protein
MWSRLATDSDWNGNSNRCRIVALQCSGREESRSIGGASNGIVGVDAAIAEKAPDIVFLPTGLPAPSRPYGAPNQFGNVIRPACRVNQQSFEEHSPIDRRQIKKFGTIGSFERIVYSVTGS